MARRLDREGRNTTAAGELLSTALSLVAVVVIAAVGTTLLSKTKFGSEAAPEDGA